MRGAIVLTGSRGSSAPRSPTRFWATRRATLLGGAGQDRLGAVGDDTYGGTGHDTPLRARGRRPSRGGGQRQPDRRGRRRHAAGRRRQRPASRRRGRGSVDGHGLDVAATPTGPRRWCWTWARKGRTRARRRAMCWWGSRRSGHRPCRPDDGRRGGQCVPGRGGQRMGCPGVLATTRCMAGTGMTR